MMNMENQENINRRSQDLYFEVGDRQRRRDKNKIREHLQSAQNYCNSIGLQIESTNLKEFIQPNDKKIRLNISNPLMNDNQEIIKKEKAFKALRAKDESNCSDKGKILFLRHFILGYICSFPC